MSTLQTRPGLIQKVLALLDSNHAGEARAAALALKRMLQNDDTAASAPLPARPGAPQQEIEACLTYATEAVALLTDEIGRLRGENARLRTKLRERRPRVAQTGKPAGASSVH